MKIRFFRILGAALAALLPACGGGQGSGGTSGGGAGNPAFPVTMQEPSAGQTFTAPATVSLSAIAADPATVAKVEFLQGVGPGQFPSTWGGGSVVATLTQPPFQATWTDAPAGVSTLVAVATDNAGAQTFSNTVTINVLAPGESPGGWMPIARLWGSPRGMSFVDANRGWVAGDVDIEHTADGGASWVVQKGRPYGCTQCLILSGIQFVDAERGWAVGGGDPSGGGVFRTTDGGATWTPSSFGGLDLSFVDANVGWVAGDNLFATKDGGVTWTPLPTGMGFQAIRFVDRQSGWALGSVDFRGVILHTTDGGLTWTEQLRADLSVAFRAMDFVNATTGWVSRVGFLPEHNRILFTSDGGATWTEQTYPGSDTISALDFVSPTQGWGAGSSSIIHTDDGGASWVTQQGPGEPFGPRFVDVRFVNVNVGWAVREDGLLLKTTTGGKAP